jgi:hypothetical protein
MFMREPCLRDPHWRLAKIKPRAAPKESDEDLPR